MAATVTFDPTPWAFFWPRILYPQSHKMSSSRISHRMLTTLRFVRVTHAQPGHCRKKCRKWVWHNGSCARHHRHLAKLCGATVNYLWHKTPHQEKDESNLRTTGKPTKSMDSQTTEIAHKQHHKSVHREFSSLTTLHAIESEIIFFSRNGWIE